jgi:hypothetical protein
MERIKAAAGWAKRPFRGAQGYFRLTFAPPLPQFSGCDTRVRFRFHSSHCLNHHSNFPMIIDVSAGDKKKRREGGHSGINRGVHHGTV